MKGKMKPAFAKGKKMPQGFMDGGMAGNSQSFAYLPPPAAARGSAGGRGMMKMADGGYACGKAGSLSGKNMKKGSK